MIFLLFVIVFVTCACVVVPLVTFGVCGARDRWGKGRRASEGT